jgi:hypothetical protein
MSKLAVDEADAEPELAGEGEGGEGGGLAAMAPRRSKVAETPGTPPRTQLAKRASETRRRERRRETTSFKL